MRRERERAPSTALRGCGRLGAPTTRHGLSALAKLLLLVIGLYIAFRILKGYRKRVDRAGTHAVKGEDMVRCAQCGVHLPQSESLTSGTAFYCCADHRRVHQNPR
jgi:uncharacterized protein